VLVENLFDFGIRKERIGMRLAERMAEPPREIDNDVPVMPRFAGRVHGGVHMRDSAFRIGHRAVLFAPGRCRQQHIGERHGIGARKRLLYDDYTQRLK